MQNTYLLAFGLILGVPLFAQTTVNLVDGANNSSVYDTTGNDTTFSIASGSATQSGLIFGSGNVIKTGAGTVVLTAANNYIGLTDIREGPLSLPTPVDLSTFTSGVSVGDSATATLSIPEGGFLFSTGNLTLGNTSAGHGSVLLDGRHPTFGGSLFMSTAIVGNEGSGRMELTSGAGASFFSVTRRNSRKGLLENRNGFIFQGSGAFCKRWI